MAGSTSRLRLLQGGDALPESDVYTILSNRRRRNTLAELERERDELTVRELSERIASIESGEDPAPRNLRESVYVSLHQTHLPTLDEHGIVDYDRDRKVVRPRERAREIRPYLNIRTGYGITWLGIYQWLGILGLFLMVAALVSMPVLGAVPPLLIGSTFLGCFAITSAYRVWRLRRLTDTPEGRKR